MKTRFQVISMKTISSNRKDLKMKNNNVTTEPNKASKTVKKIKISKVVTILLMAVAIMAIFVPCAFADVDADTAFNNVVGEFVKWVKRIAGLIALVGAIMFGLAIKNNDAEQKQAGLLTMVAGFFVFAVCGIASTFGLSANEIGNKAATTTEVFLPFLK